MKHIRDLVGRELKWTQPHALKRDFDLMDGSAVVATLRFRSLMGSLGVAETADGRWTFKRVGFWQPRVTVWDSKDKEIATFRNNTWAHGGTLVLADGREFRANSNFWMSTYELRSERDVLLMKFHNVGGLIHLSGIVEIERAAAKLEELPWLVAVGWYLVIKMRDDASGAGAAAAAAG